MNQRPVCLPLLLLLLPVFIVTQNSLAQPIPQSQWREIETSIGKKLDLSDQQTRLARIEQTAKISNDLPELARSIRDQFLITDLRTADSLYFKNFRPIDSMLADPHTPTLLRSIFYLLKAQRIQRYITYFFTRNNKNLIDSYDPKINYAALDRHALDSLMNDCFEQAKRSSLGQDTIPVGKILWLSHEPLTFLFKPDLTDIIFSEQINSLPSFNQPYADENIRHWLSLSQNDIIYLTDTTSWMAGSQSSVFRLYKDWIYYHLSSSLEASYFIETLARKKFYESTNRDSATSLQYEQYLKSLTRSPYTAVRAHGLFQLCMRWNDEAMRYNPGDQRIYLDGGSYPQNFDSAFRLYYNKVLSAIDQHRQLLDSFPVFRDVLSGIRKDILSPGFEVKGSDIHLPGSPILTFLKYRNISVLHIRVIRVSADKGSVDDNLSADSRNSIMSDYLSMPAYRETLQPLPAIDDHQWHNAFLKIDTLPLGHYVILFSDSMPGRGMPEDGYLRITVTNIAVINNDSRVFVLNRKTGFPLSSAGVIQQYEHKDSKTGVITYTTPKKGGKLGVNTAGYVTITDEGVDHLQVFVGSDTIAKDIFRASGDKPDWLYDKDDYDDLTEYYKKNSRLYMYTDRSIYRPGQTVHYKGIIIIQDPYTGQSLMLNAKNVQSPILKKLFYRLTGKFRKNKIEIDILDPFNKTIDSVKIVPNDYGSFTGDFTVPKNAATGNWRFDFEYNSNNINEGFRVEEYRRPTFELKLDKPHAALALGDDFGVIVHTRSFAGAPLGHIEVRYEITARGSLPQQEGKTGYANKYRNEPVISGQSYTDDKGELILTVSDTALHRYNFTDDKKWEINYSVNATAIDATGESHTEDLDLSLSNRPVKLSLQLPNIMDRQDLLPRFIEASSDFIGPVKKKVELLLYRLQARAPTPSDHQWPLTDISLYSNDDLRRWFGDILPDPAENHGTENKQLIFRDSLMAGEETFKWPKDLLNAGRYRLEITCRENGKITGMTKKEFSLFDRTATELPDKTPSFSYLPFNNIRPGDPIRWITGNTTQDIYSIYHLAYYAATRTGLKIKYAYELLPEKKGLNNWEYTMPREAVGQAQLTHVYLFNNHFYSQKESLFLADNNAPRPQIVIERYRKTMVPGGKEAFLLTIHSGNKPAAAELMTTLYDASLDKLEKHSWDIPYTRNESRIKDQWEDEITSSTEASGYRGLSTEIFDPEQKKALWWLDPADYPFFPVETINGYDKFAGSQALQGRVPGISIDNMNSLNDVVVIGYGSVKRELTTSVIKIRGVVSLKDYGKIMVILDGTPYKGDLNDLDPNSIVEGIVLKGADATAIYGSAAANGVLILSTKGPVQIPQPQERPPVIVRRNFSETAFFYSQLHADRKGFYTIPFTLPESVTEWKWKMFAHTKNALFAYDERTLYSQLPLMVQPDMPRFLYQGDSSLLMSRISNTDSTGHTGFVQCHVEDAVTGQDITGELLTAVRKDFSVLARSTANIGFRIAVPAGLLHPLRIKIVASAGNFSDGEEHVLPILAKKILVVRNTPFVSNNESEIKFPTPVLPNDAEPYGVGLYINPQPQAAMINALPYLASYPYGCAEQTFNKLLAYSLAICIARKDTFALALSRQQASAPSQTAAQPSPPSGAAGAEDQPGFPDERSMPWLHLNDLAALQQTSLSRLLDTISGRQLMDKYFTDLRQMQNSDGGLCWFAGGRSDLFISEYILAGFGKMKKDSLPLPGVSGVPGDIQDDKELSELLSNLVGYCDRRFTSLFRDLIQTATSRSALPDYLYARSFWTKEFPLAPDAASGLDTLLKKYWKDNNKTSGRLASMISATLRYQTPGGATYAKAIGALESLRQSAMTDTTNGISWKELSDADDLDEDAEMDLEKIAEAFEQADSTGRMVTGIIKWLLQTRQDHHWGSTRSTADIVTLLDRHRPSIMGQPTSWSIQTLPAVMEVSDNLLGGKLFAFSPKTSPFPAELTVQSKKATPPASSSGGINYYYFSADPNAGSTASGLKITKTLYRRNDKTNSWEPITTTTVLNIADKIRTTLTISAPRQLQYVFIDEKRAAALEPVEPESRYVYGGDVEYYRSFRDIGVQFFAEKIPSGISTISYEAVVDREGSYLSGPASLQCMYQPSVTAYSNTITLKIAPALPEIALAAH